MTKISIIVPIFNALQETKKCIKSILTHFDFELGEVIVFDDCSDNDTKNYLNKIAKKYPNKLSLYRNKQNLGYLKTCNKAVNLASGEIVVLCNSDCEITKDFCKKIADCFNSDNNIIAASPIASNSAEFYIPQILPLNLMAKIISRRNPVYPELLHNSEGFCFCIRKSYIEKYGLFDEIYGMGYCEEVDCCYGIKNRGGKCVLIDNLYVKHARNKSFGTKRNILLAQNNKILFNKWNDYISFLETQQFTNPIKSIITECFGTFRFLFLTLIKIKKQLTSNRLSTYKKFSKLFQNSKKSKKVIYTCISGDSDIIPVLQTYYAKDWEYVCFTDNKTLLFLKKVGIWNILPLKFKDLDSTRNARWHKMHPHILFPDYEKSIWIDANIDVITPLLFKLTEEQNKDILIPIHYCRNSIYQEAEVVKANMKDDVLLVDKQINFIKETNFPENYGLNETNIIYRKHNKESIINLMENWWEIVKNYSKRDQLSLSYVLWRNNIKVDNIKMENARIDKANFKIYSHNSSKTITGKVLKLIFR